MYDPGVGPLRIRSGYPARVLRAGGREGGREGGRGALLRVCALQTAFALDNFFSGAFFVDPFNPKP